MKCPYCGQAHRVGKLGIYLPQIKARLVDLIAAAGDVGVTSNELHYDLYRGSDRVRTPAVIRVHITQINDLLEETNWQIVCDSRGTGSRWYLKKRQVRRIAA